MKTPLELLLLVLNELREGGLLAGYTLVEVRISPSFDYFVNLNKGQHWHSLNTESIATVKDLRKQVEFFERFETAGTRAASQGRDQ